MNKVYEIVTNRIINQLERGTVPWHQSWFGKNACISYSTGKQYSLINQMLLGEAGEYITWKQVQEHGGRVKDNAKSKVVVFWKMMRTGEVNEDGELEAKVVPILRYYRVFNIKDCEGIEPKHIKENNDFNPIEEADKIISEYLTKENIGLQNEDYAAYSPTEDAIKMPKQEQFESEAEYYSTFFHEMVHSTGAETRLNRISKEAFFGNESYSKEELVAEIGSAFMMNDLSIEGAFNNSCSYIDGWLSKLKKDPKMIISASSKAEKEYSRARVGAFKRGYTEEEINEMARYIK